MAKDLMRDDLLVQDALKGVVRKVLTDAGKDGLAGDHHFYISFRTDFPGVRVSNRLREKYPQEMTIVLQHQFWDLGITEHTFEVGLSFSGVPERLLIPFDALTGFFDPSVQFGLKFEAQDGAEEESEASTTPQRQTPGVASEPVELQPKKSAPAKGAVGRSDAKAAEEVGKAIAAAASKLDKEAETPAASADVVSLDAFRKKS